MPATTPRLNIHKWNSLLPYLILPLAIIFFPGPWTTDTYRTLLLALYLTTVMVRHPENFVIPMAVFISPRLGSCFTPIRINSNPNTTLFRQKSTLLTLPLPLPPHPILKFLQRSLPVDIQILLPVILPVNTPQD